MSNATSFALSQYVNRGAIETFKRGRENARGPLGVTDAPSAPVCVEFTIHKFM